MTIISFYFQLHQPFLLHPTRDRFFWEERNREIFLKKTERCYLPGLTLLRELLKDYRAFKIALGISGTFLEQAELYRPDLIERLQELFTLGKDTGQVECLGETYYHSLTSLFSDPELREFRDQVALHREKLQELFDLSPTSFRNTELIYNNRIAEAVQGLGYQAMLCEVHPERGSNGEGPAAPPARIFQVQGGRLIVIPRNRALSEVITRGFSRQPLSPEGYVAALAKVAGDAVLLGYDLAYFEGQSKAGQGRGFFDFWRGLPLALSKLPQVVVATPGEIARTYGEIGGAALERHRRSARATGKVGKDKSGWFAMDTQQELFRDIEDLEADARAAGGDLWHRWRHLTTSDHLYFLREDRDEEVTFHNYVNPYDALCSATHLLTRKIADLEMAVRPFPVTRKKEQTAVLMISPETGRLPAGMGGLAKYIFGKAGGQGEVVSALCEGLTQRGLHVHLITLNLKKRFRREARLSEQEWQKLRYAVDPQNIHLVSSSLFADNISAYSGDALLTAAEFQKETVNNLIKEIRARHEGLIIHSHDWMAGGAITAYARARGLPVLHTVHNVFTAHLPIEHLRGVDYNTIGDYLYKTEVDGAPAIDCQATAIKNASLINFVGEKFLEEVVQDYFLDREIVPVSVRKEVKEKYYSDAAWSILNAPSTTMYPETCDFLVRKYGPADDVLAAKEANLREFQLRTGLTHNPEALLYYWPSRLDPLQKGVELLEEIALPFVAAHPDVQIAIVADGVGDSRRHTDTLGGIALASRGRIAYQPYQEELSLLGYAAAHDVFGVSLYEPCGQIDQVGNLFGATATNRDTGGYHDKIEEMGLQSQGAPQDGGNGFLFRDFDAGGLWYGLERSLAFHRLPREVREGQIKRIMREAREKYHPEKMIAEYIRIYEILNNGKPLV